MHSIEWISRPAFPSGKRSWKQDLKDDIYVAGYNDGRNGIDMRQDYYKYPVIQAIFEMGWEDGCGDLELYRDIDM